MEPKRMKIVEFDDEGQPVVRQGPSAEPRASIAQVGPVKIVSFDDELAPAAQEAPAPGGGPRIKVREFGGVAAPAGAPARSRAPDGGSMKIVEFGEDGAPLRRARTGGRSDIKIVEFD